MLVVLELLMLHRLALTVLLLLSCRSAPDRRPSQGLGWTALNHPEFSWIRRSAPPFEVHFLTGSYPAAHQDSLIDRLDSAQRLAFQLLGLERDTATIQVFFLESRLQMETLLGRRATGFAEPSSGTVLLMTNPDWRAFERHEIMHVVAERMWGPAGLEADWLREGLAQFADGHCGRYNNEQVTGRSLQQLEREWQAAMATISARPGPEEVAQLRIRGCG